MLRNVPFRWENGKGSTTRGPDVQGREYLDHALLLTGEESVPDLEWVCGESSSTDYLTIYTSELRGSTMRLTLDGFQVYHRIYCSYESIHGRTQHQ